LSEGKAKRRPNKTNSFGFKKTNSLKAWKKEKRSNIRLKSQRRGQGRLVKRGEKRRGESK